MKTKSRSTAYAKIPAEIKAIKELKDTRSSSAPSVRLEETRAAAHRLRDKLSSGPQAAYYRTFDLIRAPYPSKYGLLNAFSLPTPFMHILNRLFVVQYESSAGLKTLLFSPSDLDGNAETPFFKRLANSFGPFRDLGKRLIAPTLNTVEDCLAQLNLRPDQIDYISYDHLHTQELRKWLGTNDSPAFFPNAKLLVMRQEWESANGGLLPPQADWYCPDGTAGVDPKKIVLLDHDSLLGDGVALIRSPGHTEGNHSLAVNTPEGVLVSSENGVSADSYSPLHSRVPGVRKYAEKTGMEVILNGNTLEGGLDQYISMVLEKELAGPSPRDPNFYNVVPSSEMTWYWAFPGIKPTFSFGQLEYGELDLNTRANAGSGSKSKRSAKSQRVDRRRAA